MVHALTSPDHPGVGDYGRPATLHARADGSVIVGGNWDWLTVLWRPADGRYEAWDWQQLPRPYGSVVEHPGDVCVHTSVRVPRYDRDDVAGIRRLVGAVRPPG